MNLIKRFVMGFVGLVLALGGVRLMTVEAHWMVNLLLGGAAAVGAGLVLKALLSDGGGEGGGKR